MHNRQGLTPKLLWQALCDFDLWPIYLLGLTWTIPAQPVTAYLTLNLKQLGFDTFQTNLLTVPAWVLFGLQLLFWTWMSEKINNRFIIVLVCQIWLFPLILALELLGAKASPWAWYAVSALVVGHPYIHAILGAMVTFRFTSSPAPQRVLTLGPSDSRVDLAQRRLRADPDRRQRAVQHVCASQQRDRFQRKTPVI